MNMPLPVAALVLTLAPLAAADVVIATTSYTGVGLIASGNGLSEPFLAYTDSENPFGGIVYGPAMGALDVIQGNSYAMIGDFPGMEALLTDGIDSGYFVGFKVIGGNRPFASQTEASHFAGIPGVGTPDLAGYDLTQIRVSATSYAVLSSFEFEITFQFEYYATVPSPAAATLLGLATLRRRRR